jgi:hypothetical protein
MIQQTQTKQTAKLPAPPRQHEITIVGFRREGVPKDVCRAPAEPSSREAYGCVEWFNYQEHPLDKGTSEAPLRVKALKERG